MPKQMNVILGMILPKSTDSSTSCRKSIATIARIQSGNNGFPQGKSLQVAIGAFSEFLLEHDLQVYLVVFGSESVRLSAILVHNVQAYIDENSLSNLSVSAHTAPDG